MFCSDRKRRKPEDFQFGWNGSGENSNIFAKKFPQKQLLNPIKIVLEKITMRLKGIIVLTSKSATKPYSNLQYKSPHLNLLFLIESRNSTIFLKSSQFANAKWVFSPSTKLYL